MGELRTRCTNLSLGRLAELRPSYDPNDWQANQNNDEWKDLTIKVYGSDANDLISDGVDWYSFNPQGWVITTGAGDDSCWFDGLPRLLRQEGQC